MTSPRTSRTSFGGSGDAVLGGWRRRLRQPLRRRPGQRQLEALNDGDGPDVFEGGTGVDTVFYKFRSTAVTVDLDGFADDGARGEGDNVLADVENLVGGVRVTTP